MAKFIGKMKGLFIETDDVNINDIQNALNAQSAELGFSEEISTSIVEDVNIDTDNLISINLVYENNDLNDLESSIFKVDQIKNVLPENLPKEAKKESVIGMMGVSKLTVDTVLLDAEKRTSILNSALSKFTDETLNIFSDTEEKIAELEDTINSLRSTLTERKKLQEDQAELIEKEIDKINSIVNFIK